VKDGYNNQYENWMPWIEDQYLKWFTNDNKTSYAAKGMFPSHPSHVRPAEELKTDTDFQR
jgi:hypothetical protein